LKCGRKRHFSTRCPYARKEESLSITMEKNLFDEENVDNQKEKPDS
jgi:hypothetical protein